jgi:hypothetical protein
MSDRGIPKTFRHIHGFGSQTFSFISAMQERINDPPDAGRDCDLSSESRAGYCRACGRSSAAAHAHADWHFPLAVVAGSALLTVSFLTVRRFASPEQRVAS